MKTITELPAAEGRFDNYLSIDELDANTQVLRGDPRVTIARVGTSRSDRPIEMITIGEGDRDALIVGAPHPNEPAGTITVERMIALLLENEAQRRGYRWHFIKAIDPEGLRLNEGWLKAPRTIGNYLEHVFRPALHRQPETTFPLHTSEFHFDRSTPENEAWQRAFALTKPCLHASLHHCDFGGVFYSLSRALPQAIEGLDNAAARTGLGINSGSGGVMGEDRWSPAVTRYPSASELAANAKASGDAWAYPWTLGEMSPAFGETKYGTLTLVAEVPMWDSEALHSDAPSGVTRREQAGLLRGLVWRTHDLVLRYAEPFMDRALSPDAQEYLWAIQGASRMSPPPENAHPQQEPGDADILSLRDFEDKHTHQALFVLRTQGYLLGLSRAVLKEQPDDVMALETLRVMQTSLKREVAALEARSTLKPLPLDVLTGFQMQAIFICAEALVSDA
jgi:hypothetical protein